MLYEIAHFLRHKMPFLWDMVDIVNSFLFSLRYRRKLVKVKTNSLISADGFTITPISECKIEDLVAFFTKQTDEAFTYFRPHGFDAKSIKKLQGYKAFLAYTVKDDDNIVGYFFMRSFFWGESFIGRMVDVDYRGKGIAKMMNRTTMAIASTIGLRVFQTISPENISSRKSAEAENELRIIKTMPNGDLFVENMPKKGV